MVKTSIIVPVYNTEKYLKECFDSIFNQTQKQIEVIAVNDGSTDNSLHILEEIKREHPEMIIYSQENKGLGSARNKGLELATGEYIYFIDSDDCLADNAMDVCNYYASQNHLDIVMFDAETFGDIECDTGYYNRAKIITERNKVFSGEEFANKYWLKTFCPSACLLYTSSRFIREHHFRFLPEIYYEDNEYYCKIISLAKRIMYIPQALYRRRYRALSITSSPFGMRHAKNLLQMVQAVNRQQNSIGMRDVMKAVKLSFMKGLLDKCMMNGLLKDQLFAREIYETALDIYMDNIAKGNSYHNIDILYYISNALSDTVVSCEEKKVIENEKREIFIRTFHDIPFGLEDKYVGIYGTGKDTKRFLDEYRENIGEIKADLIFIDSNAVSREEHYMNHEVLNVKDIGRLPLECILIASSKYEQEMCQIIKEKYGNRFKVVRLRTDLKF